MKVRHANALALALISRIRSARFVAPVRSNLDVPGTNADRFLIFSLPRSGSTTLHEILQCHPQVRCALEPFNLSTKIGKIYGPIENRPRLEAALSDLWKSYNGIKHVWNQYGFPFGQSPERPHLNRYLLEICNARVIFLKRRNVLKRIVSNEISQQSRKWGTSVGVREAHLRYDFSPLNIRLMRSLLEQEFDAIASCREILIGGRIPFIDVWYEDLYGEDELLATGPAKVREIISFLGLPQFDQRSWVQVMSLLNPERTKVNSKATYLRIPNIDEVERVLGADETGWLFR